ncbi:MAG: glutamine--fructose-6-phosphate transaminase (isomerizing), partial [Acidobacteria bacterium]
MCGIVGYIGARPAVDVLVPALKRLEYRGYDSAGVATVHGGALEICKASGNISSLQAQFSRSGQPGGNVGIAHTRWATHGRPCESNAHPHVDCGERLAVVHNGIIENHLPLRASLSARGHHFQSQTDTEVIAHLIESHRARSGGDLVEAVSRSAKELKGSFAIACIAGDRPDMLVAVRGYGSPLVIACEPDEAFVASDIPALVGRSREVVVLEEGDMAILTRGGAAVCRLDGRAVRRSPCSIPVNVEAIERNGFPHFMLKEIFEQPDAVRHTLAGRISVSSSAVHLEGHGLGDPELASLSRVSLVACGTSWHAALLGKYLIEDWARLSADAEVASELRHRRPVVEPGLLVVPISQSGETADTLAASRLMQNLGTRTLAISNIVGSSLAREADGVFYTRAGLEIGVAATKTFTTQIAAVTLLALKLGLARGAVDMPFANEVIAKLVSLPLLMRKVLECSDAIRHVADALVDKRDVLFLGRGLHYPMALEGALKLKEISYQHAEGYPSGEMKHGPIALVEAGTPVVALATCGPTLASMASNIQEVKAREGFV